ncbi:MAG: molybdenum cofactor guanylyltransferase [Methanospirillaceae archaeon]|nr:molybdenum cofactor guanylyltransferase [Methanospirillaceae archaeon]
MMTKTRYPPPEEKNHSQKKQVSCLILVGGEAKRFFGTEKYFLTLDSDCFLERQIRILTPLCDEILLITRDSSQCTRFSDIPHVRCIPDIRRGTGPVGGLHAGVISALYPVILLVACDMPCIKREVFEYLLSFIPSYEAVIPVQDSGIYEMLHAVYQREALARILCDSSITRLSILAEKIHTKLITINEIRKIDPGLSSFTNINSREDLKKAGIGGSAPDR